VQELEDILNTLNPAHAEATAFLRNLNNVNARSTVRLHSLCNRPAAQAVEDMASSIANIIHSSYQVALKICNTKTVSPDHNHYNPRSVSKKRCSLIKKLGHIKTIQAQLNSSTACPEDSVATVLEHNKENQPLCKAIIDLTHLKRDSPLHQQLEELYSSTKESINFMDETCNKERNTLSRKKQKNSSMSIPSKHIRKSLKTKMHNLEQACRLCGTLKQTSLKLSLINMLRLMENTSQ